MGGAVLVLTPRVTFVDGSDTNNVAASKVCGLLARYWGYCPGGDASCDVCGWIRHPAGGGKQGVRDLIKVLGLLAGSEGYATAGDACRHVCLWIQHKEGGGKQGMKAVGKVLGLLAGSGSCWQGIQVLLETLPRAVCLL